MMIPQTVQELSHLQTQTHTHTHLQTDTTENNTTFATLLLHGW